MGDIMTMNGGAIIAMAGKNCVAISSDLRLGSQMLTVQDDYPKVHKVGDRLFVGLSGLATDTETVLKRLKFRKNLYELRENREMSPKVFGQLFSNLLYEHRFGPYFTYPIVAGLDSVTYEPYLNAMDLIGCITTPQDFVVVGGQAQTIMTAAEAYWRPHMNPDELFEACSQSLLGALERDAHSGWGAVTYVITKEGITGSTIKARLD